MPAGIEQVPRQGDGVPRNGYQVPRGAYEVPAGRHGLRCDDCGYGLPAGGDQLQRLAGGDPMSRDADAMPASPNRLHDDGRPGSDAVSADSNAVSRHSDALPSGRYGVLGGGWDCDQVSAIGDQVPSDGNALSASADQMPRG